MDIISKRIGKFIGKGQPIKIEGEEDFRPEVDVSIASLRISDITEKNGMKQVSGTADDSEFSHSGFISPSTAVYQILEKGYEAEKVMLIRFEKIRKKNVDPKLPILEISSDMNKARKNITKIVSGVYDFNNKKWILTDEAQSNPDEDPENINIGIENLAIDTSSFFNSPAPVSAPIGGGSFVPSQNKEEESKTNALVSLYFFIVEQEKEHDFKIPHGDRLTLAKLLLDLADGIQTEVFELETPVYSAYSHTRARFMLFQLIENLIPLNQESVKNLPDFSAKIRGTGIELWNWAKHESEV